MNRRDTLKTLLLGTAGAATATALPGCRTDAADASAITEVENPLSYLTPKEQEAVEILQAQTLFTDHEKATVQALADQILPPGPHGGIVEAGVVEYIEFYAKEHEIQRMQIRGGLVWLDRQSSERYAKPFVDLSGEEQRSIMDDVAYYDAKVPAAERPAPVNWFSLMRNLTSTGYFSSEVGIRELGYQGNQANIWDGVPQEVLDKHGVAYDPDWIAKCVDQSKREDIAEWDENGNLLT